MSDLSELRDLYAHDSAEWKPIRDEGATDMRYAAGDPWEPRDREDREKAGRPCISADELSQYVNQVVNEVRANKRAVKFTPVGNGANDKTAQFYADKMREIEYRSRAQIAYTTAFENCVQRSFGFVRVNSRYQHSRAVNADLWIDPVHNPNLVTPDSQALMPDLSDMGHCWVRESWDLEEFNTKWPGQKIRRFTSDLGTQAGDWITEKRIFVGEFWKITTKRRKLLIAAVPGSRDPIGVFDDEFATLPDGAMILDSRDVDDPTVVQQLTNGLEILEQHDWPGKYIPIVGCLGKVLYVAESGSEKRKILSIIRLGRDSQMMFAYLLTAEAETVGSLTKFPYFAYEGQLSQGSLDSIARSLHEPVSVVLVKPTVDGTPMGTILPFPQRNPWTLDLASIEMAKESVRRAIQASVMGSPLPTSAQRRNEKSGVALQRIEEAGQKGSFHFTDHYLDMLTHVGIICEDLIDKIYDTPRDVGIRKDDDTAETVRINDPSQPESVSTKGDHLVTVSTGPSFDSERDAANDFADGIVQGPALQLLGPEKGPKVLAKAIKLKNMGPIGDQIAEIISPEPQEGGGPDPQQAQQALQQMQGQLQQLAGENQQLKQAIDGDLVKMQAQKEIKAMDLEFQRWKVQQDSETKLAVAELGAKVDRLSLFLAERERLGLAQQVERDRMHEMAMGAADAQHDQEMARMGHQQMLEQGEQGQQHAMEQQALAPESGAEA